MAAPFAADCLEYLVGPVILSVSLAEMVDVEVPAKAQIQRDTRDDPPVILEIT